MVNLEEYKSKIGDILNNIIYLKNNTKGVYGTNELNNIYNVIKHNESSAINEYINDKNDIVKEKLLNWLDILVYEKKLSDEDLLILSRSNEDFIKEFNNNLIKINNIDKEITTKDKIINYNQYAYESKQRLTTAMKQIILYLGLMIIPVLFISLGYISLIYGFVFIFFCGMITIVAILVKLVKSKDVNKLSLLEKNRETAKDFVKNIIKDVSPKSFVQSCPKRCRNPGEEEEELPPSPVYDYKHGNEVWLDNSQNVWKKGDIPTIGGDEEGYLALGEDVEPMPYYKGDKNTPKYKCRWKYSSQKMTNMNKGLTFMTTIPCEFYPGYETINI